MREGQGGTLLLRLTMFRFLRPALLPILFVVAVYSASPFVAAYRLHESIRSGDVAAVEGQVEWSTVRESLRGSIKEHLAIAAVDRDVTPSFFKRLKYKIANKLSPLFLGSMLDKRVSAQGFVDYMAAKKKIDPFLARARRVPGRFFASTAEAGTVAVAEQPKPAMGMLDLIQSIEVPSLTQIAFVVSDKFDPSRAYRAVLELRDFAWMLTEVRVLTRS